LAAKICKPSLQAIREALKAILLMRQAAEADRPDERLELWRRAETALYESAWQTRRATAREMHGTDS
jgi:hypothetical protein